MVPVFSECFSHFYTDAVKLEIVLVLVCCEEFGSLLTDGLTHGDNVERCIIWLARFNRAEEVRDAHKWCNFLTGIMEPCLFCSASVVGVDHKIVAIGIHREVAVHKLWNENAACFCVRQLLTQDRANTRFEVFVGLTFVWAILPLVAVEGGLVDVLSVLVDSCPVYPSDAADDEKGLIFACSVYLQIKIVLLYNSHL